MNILADLDRNTTQLVAAVLHEILSSPELSSGTVSLDPSSLIEKSPLLTESVMANIIYHRLECLGAGAHGTPPFIMPSEGPQNEFGEVEPIGLYILDVDVEAVQRQYDSLAGKYASNRARELVEQTRPICSIVNGDGVLRFPDTGKETTISGALANPFKLLAFLLPHPGKMFASGAVFHAMTDGVRRYITDARYTSSSEQREYMSSRIRIAIKELQKDKKLQGRIRFAWGDDDRQVGLEISD